MEGFNEMDAADRIRATCDVVLKMTEVKNQGEKEGFLNREIGGDRLNMKAFSVMCSQFAIILRAGIPIARTIRLIAEKTTDKKLKRILNEVAEDVEAGRSVAGSFEDRSKGLFPPTFAETLRAGEETGSLDKAFQTVYDHTDRQTKNAGRIRQAMAYPLFVLVIAVVVVAVLMIRVVPTFMAIFDSYDAELPGITKALIGISNFFSKWWMLLLAVIAVIIVAGKLYGNTEKGRLNFAKLALKLPVFGNINELNAASQFANTMATMLQAGMPMTRAVSITAKVISNYHISLEVGKLSGKLEEGRSLGDSLRESACLPDILVDMVAVGEETGELEKTLNTVAGYYDTELEMAITSALNKLEPTVLIVMAAVAGFIVIAVYMAMFQMYSVM